jgi:hypothetical protein
MTYFMSYVKIHYRLLQFELQIDQLKRSHDYIIRVKI